MGKRHSNDGRLCRISHSPSDLIESPMVSRNELICVVRLHLVSAPFLGGRECQDLL